LLLACGSPRAERHTHMADDPKKKGHDGKLVSQQPHELDYLAKKHELPKKLVANVIDQEGPSRKKVENYLSDMKKNGKK
jgi:hypothetical protein